MSTVHETAYPRLKLEFTEQELIAIYTPTPAELKFVAARYRQVSQQTLLLLQLKLLQRLGYFVALSSVPLVIIEHICSRAQVRKPSKAALVKYDKSGTKHRQQSLLRDFVGIQEMTDATEKWLAEQALQAAHTKQELPDIINVLIEELIQRRFELPGFTYLFRLARNARATINDRIYKTVAGTLPESITTRIDGLLKSVAGKSAWDSLKREPKQPNVREVTDFLQHIDGMSKLANDLPETRPRIGLGDPGHLVAPNTVWHSLCGTGFPPLRQRDRPNNRDTRFASAAFAKKKRAVHLDHRAATNAADCGKGHPAAPWLACGRLRCGAWTDSQFWPTHKRSIAPSSC